MNAIEGKRHSVDRFARRSRRPTAASGSRARCCSASSSPCWCRPRRRSSSSSPPTSRSRSVAELRRRLARTLHHPLMVGLLPVRARSSCSRRSTARPHGTTRSVRLVGWRRLLLVPLAARGVRRCSVEAAGVQGLRHRRASSARCVSFVIGMGAVRRSSVNCRRGVVVPQLCGPGTELFGRDDHLHRRRSCAPRPLRAIACSATGAIMIGGHRHDGRRCRVRPVGTQRLSRA